MVERLALILAAAIVAAPASAVPALPPSLALPPAPATGVAPGVLGQALGQAIRLAQNNDCRGALALLDPLVPAVNAEQRLPVQLFRLRCLGPAGRGAEVPALQKELAVLAPRDRAVRSLGVLVAADEARFADVANQMATLAADDPQALLLVPGAVWEMASQNLTVSRDYAPRDRAAVALAQVDWRPADKPDLRDGLAELAIGRLLDEGRKDEATQLLGNIEMPEYLFDMAIVRRFQSLWPAIEARMGPHGTRAVDSFAGRRLELYTNSPGDERARRDAVRAYVLLGRNIDAAALGDQVEIVSGMSEEATETVRLQARALAASGDSKRAIVRLQALAALDPATTRGAAGASILVAELLNEAGRDAEGLKVARDGLAPGGPYNGWGKGWLRRTEVCTLQALGRRDEARASADLLVKSVADNEPAAVEGLLCAGRPDEASVIAVKTLATNEGAERMADQFQPGGALFGAGDSRLRLLWTNFLQRREVRAAFDRTARVLPQTLWPVPGERPIPRDPAAPPRGNTT